MLILHPCHFPIRLQLLIDAIASVGGIYLITSDHGNCDDMAQRNKKTHAPLMSAEGKVEPLTSHTLNPVRRGESGKGGW